MAQKLGEFFEVFGKYNRKCLANVITVSEKDRYIASGRVAVEEVHCLLLGLRTRRNFIPRIRRKNRYHGRKYRHPPGIIALTRHIVWESTGKSFLQKGPGGMETLPSHHRMYQPYDVFPIGCCAIIGEANAVYCRAWERSVSILPDLSTWE